jgi:hypothetical protein
VVEQGAPAQEGDDQRVDTWQVEVIRPRRVGAEQVAQEALRRRGLDRTLVELGFNRHQLSAAIGSIRSSRRPLLDPAQGRIANEAREGCPARSLEGDAISIGSKRI